MVQDVTQSGRHHYHNLDVEIQRLQTLMCHRSL